MGAGGGWITSFALQSTGTSRLHTMCRVERWHQFSFLVFLSIVRSLNRCILH